LFNFLAIGLIRGRIVGEQAWKSAVETLFIGGSAAAVAFLVGWLLEGLTIAP
jgi:VIT1/CCC1 family predicted Fe2+/Mn2+ transporter